MLDFADVIALNKFEIYFLRYEVVVASEDFDRNPVFLKNSNCWPGALLWRVEEGNISYKNQFLFIILRVSGALDQIFIGYSKYRKPSALNRSYSSRKS